MTQFGPHLKTWRAARHMSQLQLAVEADVSSRHISFLESGRAGPSRPMIFHLAEILEIPQNRRNEILEAAGFAPHYQRSDLSDDHMRAVSSAMRMMLDKHNPYPAMVMDRLWNIVDLNDTAEKLFAAAGLGIGDSLLNYMTNPNAAQVIENWAEVGHHALRRLRAESRAQGGVAALDAAAKVLASDPLISEFGTEAPLSPIISTVYLAGALRLPLISTYAQFGGAEDLAISDLKIELMFPADADAAALLAAL